MSFLQRLILILIAAAVCFNGCNCFSFQVNGRQVTMSTNTVIESNVANQCQSKGLLEYFVSTNNEFNQLQTLLRATSSYSNREFWIKVEKRTSGYFWAFDEVEKQAWFHDTATNYIEPNSKGGGCNNDPKCCIRLARRWGVGYSNEKQTHTGLHELADYSCNELYYYFCIEPEQTTTETPTTEPTTTEPTTTEPTTTEPTTTELTTTEPTTTEMTTTEPITTEPTTTEPTTTEPATTESVTTEPTSEPTTEPTTTEPNSTEQTSSAYTTTEDPSTTTGTCSCEQRYANLSESELQAVIQETRIFMAVHVPSLSSSKRKLNSAPDNRPVSIAMGITSLLGLIICYSLIFALDLVEIARQIHRRYKSSNQTLSDKDRQT